MRPIEITENCCVRKERISRRFAGDVEIIERESVRTVRENVRKPHHRAPRLVIGDALTATRNLVTKARSELVELDTFLRGITRPASSCRNHLR